MPLRFLLGSAYNDLAQSIPVDSLHCYTTHRGVVRLGWDGRHIKARLGMARHGLVRLGAAWHGREVKARHGKVRPGMARPGVVRLGAARLGEARGRGREGTPFLTCPRVQGQGQGGRREGTSETGSIRGSFCGNRPIPWPGRRRERRRPGGRGRRMRRSCRG